MKSKLPMKVRLSIKFALQHALLIRCGVDRAAQERMRLYLRTWVAGPLKSVLGWSQGESAYLDWQPLTAAEEEVESKKDYARAECTGFVAVIGRGREDYPFRVTKTYDSADKASAAGQELIAKQNDFQVERYTCRVMVQQ